MSKMRDEAERMVRLEASWPAGMQRAARVPLRDGLSSLRQIPRCECGTCEGNAEPYCPAHRYRWEYAQDEQAAHDALDRLGAPCADPPPHDMILSVAGRIAALAAHHQIPLVRRCRGCGYHCNHLAIICGGCGSALPVAAVREAPDDE